MMTNGHKPLPGIGFLTVIRDPQHGLFGGYLILNTLGRPLEFHCTAPVRPNRAQEILFGPTLEPYLYGERIGPTLLEKAKTKPSIVFTDEPAVLATRTHVSVAMSWLVASHVREATAATLTTDSAARLPAGAAASPYRWDPPHAPDRLGACHRFELGRFQLAVAATHRQDEARIVDCWREFADSIDLEEPFGRIREAIDEARRGVTN